MFGSKFVFRLRKYLCATMIKKKVNKNNIGIHSK